MQHYCCAGSSWANLRIYSDTIVSCIVETSLSTEMIFSSYRPPLPKKNKSGNNKGTIYSLYVLSSLMIRKVGEKWKWRQIFTKMWLNRFHRILNMPNLFIAHWVYFLLPSLLLIYSLLPHFASSPLLSPLSPPSLPSMKWDHITSVVQLASEIFSPSHKCLCGEPDRCGQPESSELGGIKTGHSWRSKIVPERPECGWT